MVSNGGEAVLLLRAMASVEAQALRITRMEQRNRGQGNSFRMSRICFSSFLGGLDE